MQYDIVFSWAFEITKKKLCAEVVALTQADNGLHFNALNTTAEHLEGLFMANMAQKMKEVAPYLWDLVYALLDANPLCQCAMAKFKTDAEVMEGLVADEEGEFLVPLYHHQHHVFNTQIIPSLHLHVHLRQIKLPSLEKPDESLALIKGPLADYKWK